jgi:hypothetical protein
VYPVHYGTRQSKPPTPATTLATIGSAPGDSVGLNGSSAVSGIAIDGLTLGSGATPASTLTTGQDSLTIAAWR